MLVKSILYTDYETNLPQTGKHILAHQIDNDLIVYQAFNSRIANYAVKHQQFGGEHYKFSRMSWIKPNFLWMMYRAGWARKEHQQHILAIRISMDHFKEILRQAVHSTYSEALYGSHENWKDRLANSKVRLQWDPDHGPGGEKLERKAIQLGLRGDMLHQFATEWIISIEDITPFVHEQKQHWDNRNMDQFSVIQETVLTIEEEDIRHNITIDLL